MKEQFKLFIQSVYPISSLEFDQTYIFFEEKRLATGEYFIEQGNIARQIGYINKGLLRAFYLNDKAEEITSCFCTQNNLTTSYKSLVTQTSSTLSIQAIGDTELLVIDYDKLQQLYNTSTDWQHIGRVFAEREYIVMERYASVLNNETAKEKYLRLLEEQPSVVHKANVEDIATYLGITRRTLSRIRQEISKS